MSIEPENIDPAKYDTASELVSMVWASLTRQAIAAENSNPQLAEQLRKQAESWLPYQDELAKSVRENTLTLARVIEIADIAGAAYRRINEIEI